MEIKNEDTRVILDEWDDVSGESEVCSAHAS